jgi:hypothetical protein
MSSSHSCLANELSMPNLVAEFTILRIVICSASGSIVGKPWACFTLDNSLPIVNLSLISKRRRLSVSRI